MWQALIKAFFTELNIFFQTGKSFLYLIKFYERSHENYSLNCSEYQSPFFSFWSLSSNVYQIDYHILKKKKMLWWARQIISRIQKLWINEFFSRNLVCYFINMYCECKYQHLILYIRNFTYLINEQAGINEKGD